MGYPSRRRRLADFIAIYEEVSGQDLTEFFDIWLFRPEKPVDW